MQEALRKKVVSSHLAKQNIKKKLPDLYISKDTIFYYILVTIFYYILASGSQRSYKM